MIKLKRASLALVGAGACALTVALAVPASADPGYYGNCPEGSTTNCSTPRTQLCPLNDKDQRTPLCVYLGPGAEHGNGTSDGDLHAVARLTPVLCAHIVVGTDGRRYNDLVRTARCDYGQGYVPVSPSPTQPCSCVPTASAPAVPPVTPPVASAPVDTAPAPTIVNNNTATSPLPAVTH